MCATTWSSSPAAYRITLRGVVVGEGEAFPGMFLAINPGGITRR
jgi:flagellar biosynthesis protein FlhA